MSNSLGDDFWIKADDSQKYSIPKIYDSDKILQAIDCNNMNLRYEGLVNLKGLQNVEWLSFNNCEHIDDWGMDRISNEFSDSLVYLDIRDCPNISERGLGALYKMNKLKILYVNTFLPTKVFEITCLLLQELNPNLDIRVE